MNRLHVKIIDIQNHGEISLLQCKYDAHSLSLVSLGTTAQIGSQAIIGFKPTAVAIGKDIKGNLSYSTQFVTTIKKVEFGAILTRIEACFHETTLESVITTNSAKRLLLQTGDTITMLIKASDIFIIEVLP